MECQLYSHDRFHPSEANKTVSIDSPWIHYSKLNENDLLYNEWKNKLPRYLLSTVLEQLAEFNTTSDSELITSYCAIFEYIHALCTADLQFERQLVSTEVFYLIDSLDDNFLL